MLEKGFVKFYRTIPQREWFGDDETLKVYVFLLCSIAVEDFETAGRTFRKGQFVTSVKKLSEQCRLSVRQTRTALEHLKATNDITICTTSKYSIITVNLPHETADSDTSAGTLADKHIDNRKRSKGERNKEESNKGEVGAASPPSPSPSDNDVFLFVPSPRQTRGRLLSEHTEKTPLRCTKESSANGQTKSTPSTFQCTRPSPTGSRRTTPRSGGRTTTPRSISTNLSARSCGGIQNELFGKINKMCSRFAL